MPDFCQIVCKLSPFSVIVALVALVAVVALVALVALLLLHQLVLLLLIRCIIIHVQSRHPIIWVGSIASAHGDVVGVKGVDAVDRDRLLLLRLAELVHPILGGDDTQYGRYHSQQLARADPFGGERLRLSSWNFVGE